MLLSDKKFFLAPDQIQQVAPGLGSCYASDMITVHGLKVGVMFREAPDSLADSGWRFFSGTETAEFGADGDNFGVYEVNTIANHDAEIVPLLAAPIGSAFERAGENGELVPVTA